MKDRDQFHDKIEQAKSERRSFMKKMAITLSVAPLLIDTKSYAAEKPAPGNTPPLPSAAAQNPTLKQLSGFDGYKFIGACPDVKTLMTIKPEFAGQKIFLTSWHDASGGTLPAGGGVFSAVKSTALKTDGGTQFSGPEGWCWVRVNDGTTVDARWFGVTADGNACGDNIANAIDYIIHQGGVLSFPAGHINFGLYRVKVDWSKEIKPFTLEGQGSSTIFSFDNIDPPVRPINKNWVQEPSLFTFNGKDVESYLDGITIQNLCIDYSRQRNRGGTTLATLGECHPTPHSKGVAAIFFNACLNPKVSNVRMTNIYGSGIYVRRCFNPLMERVQMYDVSSNEVVARDKRMDRDEFGGGIFFWSCYGGRMSDCVAWNTRKYTVDYLSPDNKQQMKDTLCGYIGFWSEFGNRMDAGPAPMIDWLKVSGDELDRVSRGVEIANCIAYGYVIGIKGEADVDISVINNIVLNCYLPINCSGVRGVVQRNFTDMLDAEDIKCPQGGLEQRRSHLGGMTFARTASFNLSLEISHNYVYTRKYPAVNVSRINLKFLYNYVEIHGDADMFKSVAKGRLFGLEISGNTFYYSKTAKPKASRVAYNVTGVIEKNSFIINSESPAALFFHADDNAPYIQFRDNVINGPLNIQSASSINIVDNIFSNRTLVPSIIDLHADGCTLVGNTFVTPGTASKEPIVLKGKNFTIENNHFRMIDFTHHPAKISAFIRLARGSERFIFRANQLEGEKSQLALATGSQVSSLICYDNVSEGAGALLNTDGEISGPVVNERNQFKAGLIGGKWQQDPNRVANLAKTFQPATGERLYYQLPDPDGAEGIVLTAKGWREFGHISQDEPK